MFNTWETKIQDINIDFIIAWDTFSECLKYIFQFRCWHGLNENWIYNFISKIECWKVVLFGNFVSETWANIDEKIVNFLWYHLGFFFSDMVLPSLILKWDCILDCLFLCDAFMMFYSLVGYNQGITAIRKHIIDKRSWWYFLQPPQL